MECICSLAPLCYLIRKQLLGYAILDTAVLHLRGTRPHRKAGSRARHRPAGAEELSAALSCGCCCCMRSNRQFAPAQISKTLLHPRFSTVLFLLYAVTLLLCLLPGTMPAIRVNLQGGTP